MRKFIKDHKTELVIVGLVTAGVVLMVSSRKKPDNIPGVIYDRVTKEVTHGRDAIYISDLAMDVLKSGKEIQLAVPDGKDILLSLIAE